MKRLAMILALLFVSGCGSSDPATVAHDWVEAFARGDGSALKELSTAELYQGVRPSPLAEGHDPLHRPKITIVSTTVDGDTATVAVDAMEHYTLTLNRVEGDWKVAGLTIGATSGPH